MKRKTLLCLIISLIMLCVAGIAAFMLFYAGDSNVLKAVIVDQLAINPSYRNETFINNAHSMLKDVGFEVKYIGGRQVTLEVYRKLASYNLVILRVHSGILREDSSHVCFFSSEPLKNIEKYPSEWAKNGYLAEAIFENEKYIGITSEFITNCLDGEFPNSIIVAMGCNSSINNSMAKAFVKRGAKVYIGWTRDVRLNYTDKATLEFLRRFLKENKTIDAATSGLLDTFKKAKLTYYPENAANLRFQTLIRGILCAKYESTSQLKCSFQILSVWFSRIPEFCSVSYRKLFQKF